VSTLEEESVMKVLDAVRDTVPLVAEKMQREIDGVTYH